jgi:uncharacterized protein (TIGR03435 family)
MRRLLLFATPVFTLLTVGLAQTPTSKADLPRFEVASIKPCSTDQAPQGRSGGGLFSREVFPERLTLNCANVKDLIHMAYVFFAGAHADPLLSIPIEGGPGWINSELFRVEAKAASPQSQEMLHGPMLRALLEDRFQLKIHRVTREIPVYSLTVIKGGAKLPRLQMDVCVPVDLVRFVSQFPPGVVPDVASGQRRCVNAGAMKGSNVTLDAEGMSIDELCKFTLRWMDRPVVDNTGLGGRFNIHLEYLPDETSSSTVRDGGSLSDGPSDIAPAPSIFTALQQQLGLKLAPAKGPGEFLVIDSIERPSEN